MLSTPNLSIFGCGIETGVAQMLLQHSQPIARIVQLHRMDREGVPEAVWAYAPHLASLRIEQIWESRPSGTLSHYLPGSMPVDTEDEAIPVITPDKVSHHIEGVNIKG